MVGVRGVGVRGVGFRGVGFRAIIVRARGQTGRRAGWAAGWLYVAPPGREEQSQPKFLTLE